MNRQKVLFCICLLLCGALIAGAFYLIGYKTAYDRMENAVPSTVSSFWCRWHRPHTGISSRFCSLSSNHASFARATS